MTSLIYQTQNCSNNKLKKMKFSFGVHKSRVVDSKPTDITNLNAVIENCKITENKETETSQSRRTGNPR